MVRNSRTGWMVALALVAGVAAGAVGMMSLRGGDGPYAASPAPAARSMGAASASTAFVAAVAGNCEMNPVLPSAGSGDGSESLQARPGESSASEVASLILSGKEASASGRNRDAEIDFLNACRNAAHLQNGDPIPLADAMYQLGRHYANVAALSGGKNKELFQRAERLYSASLEAYRARYGDDSEKARFAREGLVTVQQATGGKAPTAIAKAAPPPPVAAASAPPAPVAAAPASAPVAAAPATAPVAAAPATATVAAPPATAPVAAAPAPAAPVAAAPAPTPSSFAAATATTPSARATHSVARTEPPRAAASSSSRTTTARRRTPQPEESASRIDEAAVPRSAPATTETRTTVRRVEEPVAPPPVEERARVQPRRTDNAREEGEVAADVPPPPRRPRYVPAPSRENQQDASPDTGTAGGAPTAEGSPGTP